MLKSLMQGKKQKTYICLYFIQIPSRDNRNKLIMHFIYSKLFAAFRSASVEKHYYHK